MKNDSVVARDTSGSFETFAAIAFANAEYDTRLQAALLDYQTGALR